MLEPRRRLTADERLAELGRARARLRRERMLRELAGPLWRRMVELTPVLFRHEGTLVVRVLRAERAQVIDALRDDAIFAVDTAMRLVHGCGFLAGGDVQGYIRELAVVDRLARAGMVEAEACADTTLVRPWRGAPRLLACLPPEMPEARRVEGGYQTVTAARLRRELIGAVGARIDLFALLVAAEHRTSGEAG